VARQPSPAVAPGADVATSALVLADTVDAAVAAGLDAAARAGHWTVVAQLAKELEARRVARAGAVVVDLEAARWA